VGAAFVAPMEDVLDLYAEAPDPARPLVCFDEKPVQLLSDVRPPEAATPGPRGHPRREDYEYTREGTGNVFLSFAPHLGWRHVAVTERRTALDVAQEFRRLVDVDFPDATVIRLVLDNLNVHRLSVLYEAFAPAEARRIARKLELHHTPKHASWLHMAEHGGAGAGRARPAVPRPAAPDARGDGERGGGVGGDAQRRRREGDLVLHHGRGPHQARPPLPRIAVLITVVAH